MTARSAAPADETSDLGQGGKLYMGCESTHEMCPQVGSISVVAR